MWSSITRRFRAFVKLWNVGWGRVSSLHKSTFSPTNETRSSPSQILSSRLSSNHTMRLSQLLLLSPLLLPVAAQNGNKYPIGSCPNPNDGVIKNDPCKRTDPCPRPSDADSKVKCKAKGYKLPTRREVGRDGLVIHSLRCNVNCSSNYWSGK